MTQAKSEQRSRQLGMQITLLLFSVIFVGIITYGYFNLFLVYGLFVAAIGGLIFGLGVWFLARMIGTSPSSLKSNSIFIAMLLALSAAGIFNSFMLHSEGAKVVSDATTDAQEDFGRLQAEAEAALTSAGAKARSDQIEAITQALFSEIRSPINCGQGPEARRLIGELQRVLPGFVPLSSTRRDCSRNEEVIEDYRNKIATLTANATWNNPDLQAVVSGSSDARQRLSELRSEVSSEFSPLTLRSQVGTLEELDATYRELRFKLDRNRVDVRDIDESLHLSEVQSLGNVLKLPTLFVERLDEGATYVYLLIAVFIDFFMLALFRAAAQSRVRRVHHDIGIAGGM
jgi:hypothetical protein